MTDKYTETNKKDPFFSNREIWEQVFGADGRGGVIRELDDKIETKFSSLEEMVCGEFKDLSKKLDEYNGLREVVDEVNTDMSKHIEFCKKRTEKLDQEAYKVSTHDETFKEGKEEAFKEIKRFIAIISISLAALGTIAGLVKHFFF